MGFTESIREGVFGVSSSNTKALKHGTLTTMNLEIVAMFLNGSGSYTLLVMGGILTGFLCRDGIKSALWHGTAAGFMSGFVIAFVFAGQYGALGWKVNPKLLTTLLYGDVFWLYELTPIVAFFGVIAMVMFDVILGAGLAGAFFSVINQIESAANDSATSADD